MCDIKFKFILKNQMTQFFELSWVGVPCVLLGLVYMTFIGHKLLPKRADPMDDFIEHAGHFTTEFLVKKECPLIDDEIKTFKFNVLTSKNQERSLHYHLK